MPRAATKADIFSTIAPPRRRELIDVLSRGGDVAVGTLVRTVRMPQPAVSKHLSALRRVGLVAVVRQGRRRLYRLNARELKPVHDWVQNYERFWSGHLDRIKERSQKKATEQSHQQNESNLEK